MYYSGRFFPQNGIELKRAVQNYACSDFQRQSYLFASMWRQWLWFSNSLLLVFFFKGANLIAFQIIWLPVVMRLVVCGGVHVCVHVMERWSSENLVPRSFGCWAEEARDSPEQAAMWAQLLLETRESECGRCCLSMQEKLHMVFSRNFIQKY